jgi:hypothetical protein
MRALAGDASAVQALAEAVLQPLYCFCLYRLARNRHLCEEVVQETLVRALRDLERYEQEPAGVSKAPSARRKRELLAVFTHLDGTPFVVHPPKEEQRPPFDARGTPSQGCTDRLGLFRQGGS